MTQWAHQSPVWVRHPLANTATRIYNDETHGFVKLKKKKLTKQNRSLGNTESGRMVALYQQVHHLESALALQSQRHQIAVGCRNDVQELSLCSPQKNKKTAAIQVGKTTATAIDCSCHLLLVASSARRNR